MFVVFDGYVHVQILVDESGRGVLRWRATRGSSEETGLSLQPMMPDDRAWVQGAAKKRNTKACLIVFDVFRGSQCLGFVHSANSAGNWNILYTSYIYMDILQVYIYIHIYIYTVYVFVFRIYINV